MVLSFKMVVLHNNAGQKEMLVYIFSILKEMEENLYCQCLHCTLMVWKHQLGVEGPFEYLAALQNLLTEEFKECQAARSVSRHQF